MRINKIDFLSVLYAYLHNSSSSVLVVLLLLVGFFHLCRITLRPRALTHCVHILQRSTVSSTTTTAGNAASTSTLPDVTPAVLTTESTHVNLNASGSGSGTTPPRHPQQLINQKATATSAATASAAPATSSVSSASTHPNGAGSSSNNAAGKSVSISVDQASGMRTIELSTGRIREGFGK